MISKKDLMKKYRIKSPLERFLEQLDIRIREDASWGRESASVLLPKLVSKEEAIDIVEKLGYEVKIIENCDVTTLTVYW